MRHGTYSIVAFDPATGQHGVAVQSHWFSVGSVCAFAHPGVGAVATQSVVEPAYGPRGLERMAAGTPAGEALPELLAGDALAHVRQVAFVDAEGRVATHTGPDCIPCAGHAAGEHVSCQANMMARDGVPEAMLAAYEAAEGSMSERLLAAMLGAEEAGGDLRVEDHADPLGELERLLRLQRAYTLAEKADQLLGLGRAEEAGPLYLEASGIAPESDELRFWAGLGIAAKDPEAGTDMVRRAAEAREEWLVLLDRLSPDFAPTGAEVRRRLGR